MKRNISDLVDALTAVDVEHSDLSPLSSRRIKEMTMKKINGTYKRPSRLGSKVLIAVALLATLVVTVFAAQKITGAGQWFRQVKPMNNNQMAVIDELGQSFQVQTCTDQGTTVRATAAYADEYVLYLYLSVTAPEGTVLPDGIDYDFYDRNATDHSDPDGFRPNRLGGNAPYLAGYNFMEVLALTDKNPGDNQKEFLVTLICLDSSPTRFNDGYTKLLSIKGIYEHEMSQTSQEDRYNLIAPCDLQIDITMKNESEVLTLDVAGIHYGGEDSRTWTHDSPCIAGGCDDVLTRETDPETGLPIHRKTWEYEIIMKSMSLSSTTIKWELEYTCTNSMEIGPAYEIVMKDGSQAKTAYYPSWQKNGDILTGIYCFEVPIDLDQIDYILIGDRKVCDPVKVYPQA